MDYVYILSEKLYVSNGLRRSQQSVYCKEDRLQCQIFTQINEVLNSDKKNNHNHMMWMYILTTKHQTK